MRQRIGPYRIEQVIGHGGMGLVYKGRHDVLDRCAAIKALLPKNALDAAARQRLIHEAQAQALLTHENIVAVYDFIPEDGELFIAMEYVDGETLTALLHRTPHGRLSAGDAIPLVTQVLAALEHVHRQKITHRDVKPSNVLVRNGAVKLTDFGIALLPDAPRLTARQHMIGTIEYMSPEQLQGHDADHRSDIYSAGLVLYAMLAGQPPFPAQEPLLALSERMAGPPDLRRSVPDVSPVLWEAISLALTVEPERRFRSAAAFRDGLKDIAAGFLVPRFDPQEEVLTEVLQDSVPVAEAVQAPHEPARRPMLPWVVIVTSVTTAGYVFVNRHSGGSAANGSVVTAAMAGTAPAIVIPSATLPETPVETITVPEEPPPSTQTYSGNGSSEPTVDEAEKRRQQVAMLRPELQAALDQSETDLLAGRFDEATQEFESAERITQLYPDEFSRERDVLGSLRKRLIDARVTTELWSRRISRIEQELQDKRWLEARRDAEEILSDPNAPTGLADRARDLLRQAKEGLVAEFQHTQVSPTTNTTTRKPSTPPRRND